MHATESPAETSSIPGYVIENARVVTPEDVLENASIGIKGRRIEGIGRATTGEYQHRINARNQYLLPGFIDLHCDAIEKAIQPRPGGQFPLGAAISELDKQLAGCGITTMCHCICFMENNESAVRSRAMAERIAGHLHEHKDSLTVRNWVHARLEITVDDALPSIHSLLQDGHVQILSFMDHSPGQGQFASKKHFNDYYSRARNLPLDKVQALAEQRLAAKRRLGDSHLRELADSCRKSNIPIASHDDDTPEKIHWMRDIGVSLSEFPVRIEAARCARKNGMHVLMGAPNILRGHSLTGNLSGRKTIREGCCDVMASDFAPMSLLHAVFTLLDLGNHDLPALVRLVTSHPADVLGIGHEVGSIENGKLADLVLVDNTGPVPRITRTFVAGRQVFSSPPPKQ